MGKQRNLVKQLESASRKRRAALLMYGKSVNQIASKIHRSGNHILDSVEWKTLRAKVIAKYSGKCMCCGVVPKKKTDINVDHIKPRKYHPELTFAFDNLQVLCNRCNKDKGNTRETDYRHG